jgi:hypothetical protein
MKKFGSSAFGMLSYATDRSTHWHNKGFGQSWNRAPFSHAMRNELKETLSCALEAQGMQSWRE